MMLQRVSVLPEALLQEKARLTSNPPSRGAETVKRFAGCGLVVVLTKSLADAPRTNWLALKLSTLSALRLATLAEELTARGAPESTSRLRAGPAPLLSSTLTALAKFALPTLKKSPLAPKAAVATPSTKAPITERPTKNTVALPTHITFEVTVLIICPSPSSLALSLLLATQPTRWGQVAIPGLEGGQVAVLRSHVASAGHVMNAAYSCLRRVYVRQGTKHVRPQVSAELPRTPCMRTSQNPQKAKFAEFFF